MCSAADSLIYDNVTVEISKNRWSVHVIVTDKDFSQEFVASADSFYDGRSGIWWGTIEDYEDWA
jgi:hypothetical protein